MWVGSPLRVGHLRSCNLAYKIQMIRSNAVYLAALYAKVTPGVPVALPGGGGYIDEFDTNGNLLRRLVSNGPLNGPWGVTAVPGTGFDGLAAGDVLVGNFGNGEINAFDSNGNFLMTLTDGSGKPIVNDGLWSLAFDPGAPGSTDVDALFFTAGINQGNDGLFSKITNAPAKS
jgi:uncharacterized protein (TIGR03118 family)